MQIWYKGATWHGADDGQRSAYLIGVYTRVSGLHIHAINNRE